MSAALRAQLFYEAEHGGQTSELDVFYPEDKSYEPFVYLSDYAAASSPVRLTRKWNHHWCTMTHF